MDEQDVTQVMPPAAEVPPDQVSTEDGLPVSTVMSASRASVPRRWFAAAVVAVLLIAAGVGFYLGTRGEDASVKGEDGVAGTETVAVPDLRGMTLDRAGQEVLDAGLAAGTISLAVVEESVAPSGTVLSQDPLPGARVASGGEVDIVLAQGPVGTVVTPDVVADAGTSGSSGADPSAGAATSGDGASGGPPAVQPILPDLPPAGSIDVSKLQPHVIDPGIFKLLEPTYRTVVEHEGYDAEAWQSAALTFGDKPKRVFIVANGPQFPVAVWSWGPADSDWVLRTVWIAYPGAHETDPPEDGGGWIESFDVGPGTHTVLVRLNPDVIWWKVRIEEQE